MKRSSQSKRSAIGTLYVQMARAQLMTWSGSSEALAHGELLLLLRASGYDQQLFEHHLDASVWKTGARESLKLFFSRHAEVHLPQNRRVSRYPVADGNQTARSN
jgi:hypothetical protein